MQAYTGYYRMPWWLWFGGPFLVVASGYAAWAASQPGKLSDGHGRYASLMRFLSENIPTPILVAVFALFGLAFAWGFVLVVFASMQGKPSFQLDATGITSFSLLTKKPRFIAWRDIQRVQHSQHVIVLYRPKRPSTPHRVGISVAKHDRDAVRAAIARYRPDLMRSLL